MSKDPTIERYVPKGTPIGRVRGLGSARHGAHDWVLMRYTSVASLVLGAFLVFSLAFLDDYSFATMRAWAAQPLVATGLALMVITFFWHSRMGVAEMIGDYVHEDGNKFGAMMALSLAVIAGIAFGLFCIARIAFSGGAA
ncbi:succinate dehydrogenase, hydrophobic membrane anchor protein [Tsuneonella deserti]|uniref:Succinate dehydrogenase hydrophobic membrane anchor subunit n=1 Tax=Tsuneonella deserti TaxID=2035528 RepID=A0ABQ1S8N8_9SPHN|nr:succinate dehydrogenase, hydrophobic membrane anchor protein [Tsuneonella deserti]GGD94457.1 succinate dehydrogenase, hydrophobic membrane anchor protein [Tsuneonella deserti]